MDNGKLLQTNGAQMSAKLGLCSKQCQQVLAS